MAQLGLKVQVSSITVGQTCTHIAEVIDVLRFADILDPQSNSHEFTIWCPGFISRPSQWAQQNTDRMEALGWTVERQERKV